MQIIIYSLIKYCLKLPITLETRLDKNESIKNGSLPRKPVLYKSLNKCALFQLYLI